MPPGGCRAVVNPEPGQPDPQANLPSLPRGPPRRRRGRFGVAPPRVVSGPKPRPRWGIPSQPVRPDWALPDHHARAAPGVGLGRGEVKKFADELSKAAMETQSEEVKLASSKLATDLRKLQQALQEAAK